MEYPNSLLDYSTSQESTSCTLKGVGETVWVGSRGLTGTPPPPHVFKIPHDWTILGVY